jgi:hypothetical protein
MRYVMSGLRSFGVRSAVEKWHFIGRSTRVEGERADV